MTYAIDVHVHVFPDELADRAVASLAAAANIKSYGTGTVRDLLERMDGANVRRSVLVSIATRPAQVKKINDWLWKQRGERLIPFAAVHPDDPELVDEIRRVKAMGFKGVKLHPNYQEFYPDEKRIIELGRALADAGLILLLHGGVDWAFEEVKASPSRIARLKEAVPAITLIVAHLGGYERWMEVEQTLVGSDIYFDVSFTLPYLKIEDFLRIARKHGVEKLLFGTDYPWQDMAEGIALLSETGLTEEELTAILHGNAERLLNLD